MHRNTLLGTKTPPNSFIRLMQVKGHPNSARLEINTYSCQVQFHSNSLNLSHPI